MWDSTLMLILHPHTENFLHLLHHFSMLLCNWVDINGTADFTCSMIFSFKIMLMVEQFMLEEWIMSTIFSPHSTLSIMFTFVPNVITRHFLAVWAKSLLLCLLPDILHLKHRHCSTVLHTELYSKVHKGAATGRGRTHMRMDTRRVN